MHLSMSNLRQRATKIPGITISPNPSMLNFSTPSLFIQGNRSLIGMSSFLATVTITSVPQTQKISQKNKNQSKRNPTLKVDKSMFLIAIIENKTPKTLFNAQYLVKQQKRTGIETRTVQMMLASEISKSSIQRSDLMNLGGLTCLITFRYWSGKGKLTSRRLLVEIMVAMLNWIVSKVFTRVSLTYL